ncbi:MAG TPA: LytR family transcriptional regulator, partial [Eubacteriaceae bacterium]|nr:LytR family transcriptional regulator [Eubacteriaceae bacterium]
MPSKARMEKIKRDKQRRRKKIAVVLLVILLIFVSAVFLFFNMFFSDMEQVDISRNEEELQVNKDLDKDFINIALFGVDSRTEDYEGARTDTIMIGTLDTENGKIKLTSIMRDTYVDIPEHSYDQINHAHAYGGPELAIRTINRNFDMNLKDFVTVNFDALERIVDAVGGVEIEVNSAEVSHITGISSAGTHMLNGEQALDYSRIRKVGNADYERTERQRRVPEEVIYSVLRDKSISKAMSLADSLLPYVKTSLSRTQIMNYATKLFTSGASTIENARLPLDDYSTGTMMNGVYYLKPNPLETNVRHLHEFIYENDEYEPSDTLMNIS